MVFIFCYYIPFGLGFGTFAWRQVARGSPSLISYPFSITDALTALLLVQIYVTDQHFTNEALGII